MEDIQKIQLTSSNGNYNELDGIILNGIDSSLRDWRRKD